MKKIIMLMMMIAVTLTATSQNSIKKYELGKKYKENDHVNTTVFGREALVGPLLLNDGRAHTIVALFKDDEKSDMFYIFDKMESIFDISLVKIELVKDKYNVDRYRYEAVKNGILYILYVEENTTFDEFRFSMGIVDVELKKIHDEEINNDI
jgi:hypothetical protein